MYRKPTQVGHHDNEADNDQGYAETDPTGRYGRFEDILGKGAMKTVYKAIDVVLGIEVAWSQVKLNEVLYSPDDLQRLYSEVHHLSTLKHSSIIRFFTSWIDVDHKTFNFITEMFTSGSLREYRKKYRQVDIRTIKNWARQILEGLVYLHEHDPPVIHRDLKCDNIFVNGHLGQVKIGDLGLAAILRGSQSVHSVIGTPEFMAPELYEENYNELVDVYSFGMCVLEMMTTEYPYSECANLAQIYKKVTSGKLPAAFYRIKDLEAQCFIGKCVVPASRRLSAKELLLDPFLATEVPLSPICVSTNQKPFLNEREMQNLQLSDDQLRTNMTITGKLEDDTIFLKVQFVNRNGSLRNIFFPFDIIHDTPLDVAMEMVKELEIDDWEPLKIARMIEAEILTLVPSWKQWDLPCVELYHSFDFEEEDGSNHPFNRFSTCSSSHSSLSGAMVPFTQDDLFDDTSSQSSSHSGSYSNVNYVSCDDHLSDMSSTRKDKHLITHISSRFCPHENSRTDIGQEIARTAYEHCTSLMGSQYEKSRSKSKKVANGTQLMRNRSLVDVRSQLLHRSLVEEISKRRMFKTVGDVEHVGFSSTSGSCKNVTQASSRR